MTEAFRKALQAAGYLTASGDPVPGLTQPNAEAAARLRTVFRDTRVGLNADAVFSAQNTSICIFKDAGGAQPDDAQVKRWHEAAWNVGVAPLLWIVTPTDVRLYDCYASPPSSASGASAPAPLDQFALDSEDRLRQLDLACGRIATETGAFWTNAIGSKINRRHRVDRELLAEINALEQGLVELSLRRSETARESRARDVAQRFIGRCIFTWYLLDRGLAQPFLPKEIAPDLSDMFSNSKKAFELFEWLRSTFNGDLFPMDDPGAERKHLTKDHLALIRDFIEGRSLIPERHGQGRLFRFRFNAIPIDLISSIYQQFARASAAEQADSQGLHYTPVELVHLTLDPVFEGLGARARVIDPACGSGAFLVEAFRRLVWKAAAGKPTTHKLVRTVLYDQLHGIDINRSALGIAAFSLYLAALELDEQPVKDIRDLKFDHLINRTLFEADALGEGLSDVITSKPFDAVVGNPPWTFVSHQGAAPKRTDEEGSLRPRRSPDQAFLALAARLAGSNGRIGMVMKATPFFSKDIHAVQAREVLLKRLAPVALINLSYLRREELFPDAVGPAALVFSRCQLGPDAKHMLVGSLPWTPDFRRTGMFQLGPGEVRAVPLQRVLAVAPMLKAATFGTVRDCWLIEKLETSFPRLDEVLGTLGRENLVHRGQGFQVRGQHNVPPASYAKLKVLTPETFTAFRLDDNTLARFHHSTLHRPRRESIFRGPLLLCAKVGSAAGAERGRYSAAVHETDLLYTQNFYGVSFRDGDATFAHVLSGVLNSSVAAYQFALGGPTWGLERPTVEPHDLMSLRVPPLARVDAQLISAVVRAEARAAASPSDRTSLLALDDAVFDLYDFDAEERVLVSEGVDRARYMIFEHRSERMGLVAAPQKKALTNYASQVAGTVNNYLRARGERQLTALVYDGRVRKGDLAAGIPGTTAVRFVMEPGKPGSKAIVGDGDPEDLLRLAAMLKGQSDAVVPPYLNERRQLRLYGGKDLFILKPTEVRYWTRTAALNDADTILADHWIGRRDAVANA